MNYLFTGIAIANTILLLAAILSGYASQNGMMAQDLHVLAGLFVALFTCLTHCLVFIYFLGTGKSIKTACEERNIQGDFVRETKRLKGRAFPFALFGALAMIGAAVSGAAAATHVFTVQTHQFIVITSLLWNVLCFVFEYRAICANMLLLKRLAVYLLEKSATDRP